jgi:hypothetical protein
VPTANPNAAVGQPWVYDADGKVADSGGLSASADLFGPFTAEASAQFVVFPFTKIDTRAAMGLRLGPVEGRLGWRFTILDDQGRVDGVRNVDLMTGPYTGALLRLQLTD